jgi:hypothetical protein
MCGRSPAPAGGGGSGLVAGSSRSSSRSSTRVGDVLHVVLALGAHQVDAMSTRSRIIDSTSRPT